MHSGHACTACQEEVLSSGQPGICDTLLFLLASGVPRPRLQAAKPYTHRSDPAGRPKP